LHGLRRGGIIGADFKTTRKEDHMNRAKSGDKVLVHYTGRLEDGSVFDSSECSDCDCESGPLEFVIGEGQVIPGFEEGVVGMAPGEAKTVHIPVDRAYGERIEAMVAEIERKDLPADIVPEVGQHLQVTQDEGGMTFDVVITEITDEKVTLDANHPLAGRDLIFDLRLEKIV
jgi:peptidylprolyl isomerase